MMYGMKEAMKELTLFDFWPDLTDLLQKIGKLFEKLFAKLEK